MDYRLSHNTEARGKLGEEKEKEEGFGRRARRLYYFRAWRKGRAELLDAERVEAGRCDR